MTWFFRYFLIFLSFSLLSCFQQKSSRLSQSLEGTIVSLSDVFRLKCVLKTGESLNKKVDWTEAENITLEEKVKQGVYKPVEKSSVAYKGFNKKGEKTQGYINDFSYVSISSIEDSRSSFLASVEKEDQAKIIQKGSLFCENLLAPEQHPFIIAKAHHTYNLEFQVIGNYLRALIVASPEDLPFQALPYSIKLSDNRYGMPIGGYDIGLGYLEEVVNSDFEATRILTFREVPIKNKDGRSSQIVNGIPTIYPKGVKEIQVRGEFKPFKTLLESGGKKDIYPKELLAGDWHYVNTIVATSLSKSNVNFLSFGFDHEYKNSSKIRIVFKDKHLIAYSLNTEQGAPSSSALNKNRFVFKIPIQHVSYEASSSLSGQIVNAGLNEVLNKREDDEDKDFVQVQFSKIQAPISKDLNKFLDQPSFSLSDLYFSEDYISFVLYDEQQGTKIKHAFLRPKTNSTYTPLNVSQKSHNLFPSFYSQKRVHNKDLRVVTKAYQDSYLTNRFNTNEPIVYRFSSLTPKLKYVRDLGREAINLWNQVFEKAGITCAQKDCFVLDESKDVEFGDIRYNILNLVNPKDLRGRFWFAGYGPTVSDLETGEVIAATSNVTLNLLYDSLAQDINNYIMNAHGLDPSYRRALRLRNSGSSYNTKSSSGMDFLKRQLFSGQLRELFIPSRALNPKDKSGYASIYGLKVDASSVEPIKFITSIDEIITTKEDKDELSMQYLMATGKEPSSFLTNKEIYEEISRSNTNNRTHNCSLNKSNSQFSSGRTELIDVLCKEDLQSLVTSVNPNASPHQKIEHLWSELGKESMEQKISACLEKLIPIASLNTMTHEMGHNVSMYHNFAGSSDKDNFLELKDFKLKYVLSNLKDNEKAAILKMDATQPASSTVMDYLSNQAVNLIPGRYDVDFVRFIYGGELENRVTKKIIPVDPLKLTDLNSGESLNINHIRTYRVCNNFNLRMGVDPFCAMHDKGTTALEILENHYKTSQYYHSMPSFIYHSLPFYHKWRLELSRNLEGSDDTYYLSSAKLESYKNTVDGICQDKNHKLYDLCNSSRFFINATTGTLFSPDHYCIVEYAYTKQIDRIPFGDIHREITENEPFKSSRSSCKDFTEFLFLVGYKLIGEVGKPLFSMNFSTDKNNRPFHTFYDRIGSIENRAYSVLAFFVSTLDPVSFYNSGTDRPISIMDEPDARYAVHQSLENRFLMGDSINNNYTYNFSNEKLLLDFSSLLFLKHTNATNRVSGLQNQIKNIVRVIPYSFFRQEFAVDEGRRIKLKYLDFYAGVRREKGHIVDEVLEIDSKEVNKEPVLIIPFSKKGLLNNFIEGIRSINFKRSIIKLWNTTSDLNKEENKKLEKTTPQIYADFQEDLTKTVVYTSSLLSKSQSFTMATTSLLYDYLEIGQNKLFITDNVVPYLQLMEIYSLRAKMGLSKELELKFHPNTNNYTDTRGRGFVLSPIKPHIDFFIDYFDKNPELLVKFSKEILDIYLLGLYKSSEFENSKVHLDLKDLKDKVISSIEQGVTPSKNEEVATSANEEEVIAKSDTKEIHDSAKLAETITIFNSTVTSIHQLKKIRHFLKNKFLREVLIRDVFIEYSKLNYIPITIVPEDILNSPTHQGEEFVAFLIQKFPNYFQMILFSLDAVDKKVLDNYYPNIQDEEFHNVVKNITRNLEPFFTSVNIANFANIFQKTISKSTVSSFLQRIESLFQPNNLLYFLTHDAIYRHGDKSYLGRLMNNRLEKEMKTQEDILYNSLVPFFDIYNQK